MSLLESLFDALRGGSARMQKAGVEETETVRKIARALNELDTDRASYIAAFAYILGRVAMADLEISEDETRAMEQIVADRSGLPLEQAVMVVQIAKSQNLLFGGTENFLVTREFNEIADGTQKLQLLDCLYTVSASDENISTIEDNEIGKIARELNLGHEALIRAREAHVEYLSVLRRPDGSGHQPESVD